MHGGIIVGKVWAAALSSGQWAAFLVEIERERKRMKIILTAHNQLQQVEQRLSELHNTAGIEAKDIVIVDNASEDGLGEWLCSQTIYSYLICDEGMETYAKILNTAIAEFAEEEDVFCYTPDYPLERGALENLKQLLYSEEDIGAVSPVILEDGVRNNFAVGENINKKKLELTEEAVMIKYSAYRQIGGFDEALLPSGIAMRDFLLHGVSMGYKFMECASVYFYRLPSTTEVYLQKYNEIEQRKILRKKWGMNYFNTCPNYSLIELVKAERNREIFILEIGCDCGVNLLEIGNLYPNARLYGVEINEKAAKIAKYIAKVSIGDIEEKNLDFEGIKFDYILFGDVLEHLRDPAATIRYCKEWLGEEGKIVACIPNLMHHSVVKELLNGNFTYTDTGLLDRTHIHFFTYKEIIRMFAQEGYVVDTIAYRTVEILPEDERFVDRLMENSDGAERFMFFAFQYLVTARLK